MRFFIFLFIFTPITELWLILKVGDVIGLGPTLLLIFLTAMAGAVLLRKQGFSTFLRAREKMSEGQMPAQEMVEGLMLAFAGALMLTPGFITDVVGFLILIPQVRKAVFQYLKGSMVLSSANINGAGQFSSSYGSSDESDIIEGEFRNESPSDNEKLQ